MTNKHFETCKNIAENLYKYANGFMYNYNGEVCHENDLTISQITEAEPLCLYDLFQDAIDVQFNFDSRNNIENVRILVAWGGPYIWIDTEQKNVLLYWWDNSAEYPIDPETLEAVRDWARDLFCNI